MNEVKEVLIGAVTIAVGFVVASLIVKKVMGSATTTSTPVVADAPKPAGA